MLFFCRAGETEIGGFGISTEEDPLYIEDFATVRQFVTPVSVAFEDGSVADFFDRQIDAGRAPRQFCRIWCHTHPGGCPLPSATDEETFERVFGSCDWAVMFILAREGQTFCRLRFNAGPGGDLLIPVAVDYDRPFAASDHASWLAEYGEHIVEIDPLAGDAATTPGPDRCGLIVDGFGSRHGRSRSRTGAPDGMDDPFPCDDDRPWRDVDEPGGPLDLEIGEVCP